MISQEAAGAKLIRTNNNMDAIRYVMAFTVLVSHFNDLTASSLFVLLRMDLVVAMFFTLSGFLVFDSYHRRPSLRRYITSRARRILPPYFFIVLACAFGFAAISTLSPGEYFTSWHWWRYTLANLGFMNFIEPTLPGVFTGGQMVQPYVDGSLWTMKVEWFLYLSVPVVSYIIYKMRSVPHARNLAIFVIVIMSIAYRYGFNLLHDYTGKHIYSILARQFFGQMSFFYIGALLRIYLREFLSYKWIFGVLIVIGCAASFIFYDAFIFITPFAFSGLVIWLSMVGRWGHFLSRHDNVSYDVYLYHFPVIQLGVYFGIRNLDPLLGVAIAAVVTLLLSFASWNFIGRRFINKGKLHSGS